MHRVGKTSDLLGEDIARCRISAYGESQRNSPSPAISGPDTHQDTYMNYFRMSRLIAPDGASLYQSSHVMTEFKTGRHFGPDFVPPLRVRLDPELPDGKLPTFFESPAWIGTRAFHDGLLAAGVTNVDASPVEMHDEANGRLIDDYLLLNIVGRVACVDMERSATRSLGDGISVIDRLVIDPTRVPDLDLFVADQDTDCMIVSEHLQRFIVAAGYEDIRFEALN